MNDAPLRLIQFIPDGFPTHRPDIMVLFGTELPCHSIVFDLVARERNNLSTEPPSWPGKTFLCRNSKNRSRNVLANFFHNVRTLWRLRRGDYHAVQVRDMIFIGILARARARQLEIPFFYWMSFPIAEGTLEFARTQGIQLGMVRYLLLLAKGHLGQRLLYKHLLPSADHIFVQSERMREQVAAGGIPFAKMTPVPMGVDMGLIDHLGAEKSVDERLVGKRVIVYLGTLERIRRIDFLFEVLRIVLRRQPRALLLLVGNAEEKLDTEWLNKRARESRVAHAVVTTGWLPTREAWSYVRTASVAVSPLRPCPLLDCASPTKLTEYLALGIPIVANDQPEQRKLIQESGAGVCVPYETGAFAAAVLQLLESETMAQQMGALGPPYVRAHRGYEVVGRALAARYRELLETTSRAFRN